MRISPRLVVVIADGARSGMPDVLSAPGKHDPAAWSPPAGSGWRRHMRIWAVSLCCTLLAACATAPTPRPPEDLFNDRLFTAPSERISARDVFALSDEMKRYLDTTIAPQLHSKGPRQGLIDAIANSGQLKLEYDSMLTRNAAQAFAARSGNCLSLVIMTAAFAKALELPVRYQSVSADETVDRSGDIAILHRPRQPEPRRKADRRRNPAQERPDDHRFPPSGGSPRPGHRGRQRGKHCRDVHEQPRRRSPGPGECRRCRIGGRAPPSPKIRGS